MTSVTERLRALLDERGVKWMPVAWSPKRETFYHAANGVGFCADEYADGVRIYTDATITPEQAIDATLGRGTCKVEGSIDYGEFGCWQYDLSCGCRILWPDSEPPMFCPNCGRKVVE